MNKQIVAGIVLFVVVLSTIVFVVKRNEKKQRANTPVKQTTPAAPENQRKIQVRLFFNSKSTTALVAEGRSIAYHDELHAQIRELVRALLGGPNDAKLAPSIPQGTQLRDVFVSKDGVLFVDFSDEIVANHPGGSQGEIMTVYSIVNTLTFNFPHLTRVQILINDQPVETLKGHLDLSRPLWQDLSMVQVDLQTNPASTQTSKS